MPSYSGITRGSQHRHYRTRTRRKHGHKQLWRLTAPAKTWQVKQTTPTTSKAEFFGKAAQSSTGCQNRRGLTNPASKPKLNYCLERCRQMQNSLLIPLILIALLIFVSLWILGVYNNLVTLRNRFRNAFSQIDVQLKRRYDLIPNLVETARAYMAHERDTLEAVIHARNTAQSASQSAAANPGDPTAMQALAGAEGALTGTIGRLFALAEAYPDLKANQNMLQLTEELTSTENKVAFSRQAFNDAVTAYNTAREVAPANLIANAFGFTAAELFKVDTPTERDAPQVKFK